MKQNSEGARGTLGNGSKGYEQGVRDLASNLKNYYDTLGGKTFGALVAYTIDQKTKELLDGSEKHENNGGF